MASKTQELHILFFPFMAPGHMLPMVHMAKLFANRGVRSTILTTPGNTSLIKPIISNSPVELALIPFPSAASRLPEGCENLSTAPSPDLLPDFLRAVSMLSEPFDQILKELHPNVTIVDTFLPWTIEITSKLGITRLVFHGTGFFPLCLVNVIANCKPHETLTAETKSFLVPGIPHRNIELLKTQVLDPAKIDKERQDFFRKVMDADKRSYGAVMNTFYELEPDYVEHYRTVIGRRAWHIGPVSLCNEDHINKSSSTDRDHECLSWLDEKEPGSVLYVCFGSLCIFTGEQLHEIALGLEASDHAFIWVVPKAVETDEKMDWMPEGYLAGRINEGKKGLIVRGWAPQLLILNHKAVGGFMTHCGWNSTIEGVCAGLPMITWPLFAEQFYNERLIVDVLKIGVAVGMKEYALKAEDRPLIHGVEIKTAVSSVMGGGDEAVAMRKRARELREMAKSAVREDGSSYTELTRLISELSALHP